MFGREKSGGFRDAVITSRGAIMLIALLSDIHANREAYEACLAAADNAGAGRYVILGDIVGYGADPEWCIEKTMELAGQGAVVVRGNHDQAAIDPDTGMNPTARAAIEWTRNQISTPNRDYLARLPLTVADDDRLYVHADASAPGRWNYVLDTESARRHLAASSATASFCGHVHRPALYGIASTGKMTSFIPNSAAPIPLMAQRRWLAVMGSVGQPRDGDPRAAYGLYDTERRDVRFMRAAYDIEAAAAKIRAAGLPESLAARLERGK